MGSSRLPGTNENISTFGDGTRDYTDLQTWESATDYDLVTAEVREVLECYADAASFDTRATVFGATFNSTYHRCLRAASSAKHDGTPSSGVVFETTTQGNILSVREFFVIEDLEFRNVGNSASLLNIVDYGASSSGRVVGCLFTEGSNAGAGTCRGLVINRSPAAGDVYVVNNLFANTEQYGLWVVIPTGDTAYVYNNTAVNNTGTEGIRVSGSTGDIVAKNNLASGNTTDFLGTFDAASTHNASSDTTAPGSNARTSQTFTFVDAASDDYHLASNDAGARSLGTNLSGDSAFPFNDDVDSDGIAIWSIGMDSINSGVEQSRSHTMAAGWHRR